LALSAAWLRKLPFPAIAPHSKWVHPREKERNSLNPGSPKPKTVRKGFKANSKKTPILTNLKKKLGETRAAKRFRTRGRTLLRCHSSRMQSRKTTPKLKKAKKGVGIAVEMGRRKKKLNVGFSFKRNEQAAI